MEKQQEKEALLSDIIAIAKADKVVTPTEYDFILRLATHMGINKDKVQKLFDNPMESRVLPTEVQRITHFYKLVLTMNVDQETHQDEIIMVKNFGLKMGIRPGALDQILKNMHQYPNQIIPSEALIKIFHTYYN